MVLVRNIASKLSYFTLNQLQILKKTMATFVSRTSPVTGKVEWIPQDENYDYIQEIARCVGGLVFLTHMICMFILQ